MELKQAELIAVEVAYALPAEQVVLSISVQYGATLREAIEKSGIVERFPNIDAAQVRVGVFGKLRKLTDRVEAGDRVEIYRELVADPKDARRQRAAREKRNPAKKS